MAEKTGKLTEPCSPRLLRVLDVVFELFAEVAQGARYGPCCRIAQGADGVAVNVFLHVPQRVEVVQVTVTFVNAVQYFLHPARALAAGTQLMLPVLAAVAVAADIPPLMLMIPATLAASIGFMLPVATAPNTIIFSGEKLKVKDMAKAGFWLDLLGIIWLKAMMNLLGKWVFAL